MDPPVFHVTITGELAGPSAGIQPDDPFGNGFALQIGEDLGGPIATAFGYQRPYLRKGEDYPQALTGDPQATEAKR